MPNGPSVTAVFICDEHTAPESAVGAFAVAIDRLESAGALCSAVLVAGEHNDVARELFSMVEGADTRFVTTPINVGELLRDLQPMTDLIFITDNPTLRPSSIVWLWHAMADATYALARPDEQKPDAFMVRTGALSYLNVGDGFSCSELGDALTKQCQANDFRVAFRLDPRSAEHPGATVASPGLEGVSFFGSAGTENMLAGPHTYSSSGTSLLTYSAASNIFIGDYSSIGDRSTILDTRINHFFIRDSGGNERLAVPERGHRPEFATSFPPDYIDSSIEAPVAGEDELLFAEPMCIGSDVWLGFGTTVAGAHVGHGVIAMPGSVILQDVAPYSIVAGNPAKQVRMRFSAKVVEALLAIAWWDWPVAQVRERSSWFRRPITEFAETFRPTYVSPWL